MGRAICGGTLMNLSLRMSPTGLVLSFRSLLSCSSTRCSQLCSQRLRSSSLICSAHCVPCNQKVRFLDLIQQLFTRENLDMGISYRPAGSFPQQPLKPCTIALKSFSTSGAEGKQRLWSDGNEELQHHSKTPNCRRSKGRNTGNWQLTYPGITRPGFNSLFHSLLYAWPSASYYIQNKNLSHMQVL